MSWKFANFKKKFQYWSHFLKMSPEIKRLQHRCFCVNFAKPLRTLFLHITSGGVGVCLFKCFNSFNKFLSNCMEFVHANSKNYFHSLHFLFLHFLYYLFLLLTKILNTSPWKKICSVKLSGSLNEKVFLSICWRNI